MNDAIETVVVGQNKPIDKPNAKAPAPKLKCFVVSPIGMPGTETREHADVVFWHLICQAFMELDREWNSASGSNPTDYRHSIANFGRGNIVSLDHFDIIRSDHISEAGQISEQMYNHLLDDDIIVGLLTFGNPNVFYEVAVAHCAAKPVVLLNEQSHPLPFDIKDMRVVSYDYKPWPLLEHHHSGQLKDSIKEALRKDAEHKVPFRPALSPLGHYGRDFKIYDRYIDTRSTNGNDYIDILREAEEFFWGCGISLDSWNKPPDFRETLYAKTGIETDLECERDGIQEHQTLASIRILVMDSGNESKTLDRMLTDEIPGQIESVKSEIQRSVAFWKKIQEGANVPVGIAQASKGLIYQQIAMNEKRVLYTPYAFSVTTNESPTFQADNSTSLYRFLKREFEELWKANSTTLGVADP